MGLADQDPGMWPEVAEISRYMLSLRYKYMPYLYSLFHRAHMHGASVIRPLLNVFPDDLHARDIDAQFLRGDGVMVAPVHSYKRRGMWYNLVEGNFEADGPVTLSISAPLEVLPLYVRSGVILPFQEPSINTVDSRQNPFGLTVALGMGGDAAGEIFWDSGDGEHAMGESYMCRLQYLNNSLTSTIMHGAEVVARLHFEVISIYGYSNNLTAITVNGDSLSHSDWRHDEDKDVLTFRLKAPLSDPLNVLIA